MTHPEVALDLLKRVATELEDVSVIEKMPAKEGMTMLMILAPNN